MKTVILLLAACLASSAAFAEEDCEGGECDLRGKDKEVHYWLNPKTGEFETYRGERRAIYDPHTGEWSLRSTGKPPTYIPVPNNNDSSENPK